MGSIGVLLLTRRDRKALRVSRAWWHYISSNPALWAELEVCNDRGGRYKLVRPKTIQTYIQRAQNRVRRATLSILGVETAAECLMLIVRECPLLEYLEIRFRVTHEQLLAAVEATRRLKTLIITAPCELLAGDIEKVLMCCPTLAHMEVRSITCIDSSTPSSKMVLYYLTHVRFGSLGSPLWSFPLVSEGAWPIHSTPNPELTKCQPSHLALLISASYL